VEQAFEDAVAEMEQVRAVAQGPGIADPLRSGKRERVESTLEALL
jgi:hypothetical protein